VIPPAAVQERAAAQEPAAVLDLAAGGAPLGRTRLVCIDGPAGSGKTTLAARLAEVTSPTTTAGAGTGRTVAVVHMDDLYDGWSALAGDRAVGLTRRIDAGILTPLAAGRPGGYRRYDWPTATFAEQHAVPVVDVLVLEGCASAQRAWAGRTALAVWVEVDRGLRTRRWLERDDDVRAAMQCRDWQADEDAWFAADGTRARARLLLSGTSAEDRSGRGA
jgi:energy-coupling factor transporter ATP-binding protein EcfA2